MSKTDAELYFENLEREIIEKIKKDMRTTSQVRIDYRITRKALQQLRIWGFIVEDYRSYIIIRRPY